MSQPSPLGFPATEQGAGFFRAYDAVLSKWPTEVTSEQVQSPFGTTWVNTCGPVDGPPVILVPGQRATSTVWFNNVGELSRRHRVFAIDILGDAGRSIAAADTPVRSRDDLLAWFSGIVDHFTLDAPAVVAHSYGAGRQSWRDRQVAERLLDQHRLHVSELRYSDLHTAPSLTTGCCWLILAASRHLLGCSED